MSETRGIPACDLTARNVADTVLSCINGDMSPYPAFSLGMAVPYATDTLRRRGGVVSRGDAVAAAARAEADKVLRGAPVSVDVVCIDRAGAVVGSAR